MNCSVFKNTHSWAPEGCESIPRLSCTNLAMIPLDWIDLPTHITIEDSYIPSTHPTPPSPDSPDLYPTTLRSTNYYHRHAALGNPPRPHITIDLQNTPPTHNSHTYHPTPPHPLLPLSTRIRRLDISHHPRPILHHHRRPHGRPPLWRPHPPTGG